MPLFKKSRRSDPVADALVPNVAMAFGVQGFPMAEATAMAIEVVEEATRESRAAGGGHPPGYGDELVRRAHAGDRSIAETYRAMQEEGVSDDDIRWYWNLSDIEKRVTDRMADQARLALFIHAMQEFADENPSHDKEQLAELAAERVRKVHPMFGDPADHSHASGDDRPLFPELKDRIDRYIEANFSDLKALHRRIKRSTSFNAWVRAKMRAGKL